MLHAIFSALIIGAIFVGPIWLIGAAFTDPFDPFN
jgi:hypothetical protein